jgi:microcystin-dependent protein
MPLNKLDSIIKNTEGRILYVSPADLDSTDSISNQGNSLARPFKTLQRALLESARFSYIKGNSNDETEKTTILLMPGEHVIDNRPGYAIDSGGSITTADGSAVRPLPLTLDTVFDLTQKDNDLYKFNSVNGGVIVPRGTSIVGLDLRKTKLRPLYVPNPTDDLVPYSSLFRITGACYLWQFSIFDASEFETVYTQHDNFDEKSTPTFSHHKLTVFEYADGVNEFGTKGLTDLQMYYAKLSNAYEAGSGRPVDTDDRFQTNPLGFNPRRPEFEIVGAFASDPITITSIQAGDGLTATRRIKVTTQEAHELNVGTPIRIEGVSDSSYNISTKVTSIDEDNDKIFFYNITKNPALVNPGPFTSEGTVTIETDTVTGASPYIFNISMRSVWGMQGMHADGSKATGFRSMVVAQFTGVSLQKDDRAFVKYNESTRQYENTFYSAGTTQSAPDLATKSSSTGTVYHLDSGSVYRKGWEQTHIKITNDAIVQVVSVFAIGYNKHFVAESGGDASITNSNSNFGQLSLVSDGFKKEAFDKDNKAFITHIIPPRAIESTEEDIDWLTLDQDVTNTLTKLYIFGFKNKQVKPPVLTQGYRIGAKVNDKLFLGSNSASILMPSGASSFEEYSVGAPSNNLFTVSNSGTHNLSTGEKVIITSDDGDLPENLRTNTVYFAIVPNNTTFKLAASLAEATSQSAIEVYGGTNLKVTTRVSDKEAGDVGHPVQHDDSAGQWYITVSASENNILAQLTGSGATDEPTTVKRISDNRSLDEKIYKLRVVVPSQFTNAKTPEPGFVIQESSSTGFRVDTDATAVSIGTTDYDFNRNLRIIKSCSFSSPTVTVVSELPHNLITGDSVVIRNVTDSTNTGGLIDKGYNGTFTITVVDDLTFTYTTSATLGTFTNNVNTRTTALPRFERNNLQENIYVYRNEVISEYEENDRNGVYHIYALNANNAIQSQFTNLKYSQNVTDLYPQLDRDNVDDNPNSSTTYALRSPLGEVQTDDLKKSITRETTDKLLTTLGIGLDVSSVTNPTSTSPTIVFDRNHSFAGIATGSVAATSGFTAGTYHNVKISTEADPVSNPTVFDNAWKGATAKVVVDSGTNISSVEIINGGSNYSAGTYYLDTRVIGTGNNNAFTVVTSGLTPGVGQAIQFTGIGTGTDTYHRITGVTARNSVSIARTTGDPVITSNNYGFVVGPALEISTKNYDSTTRTLTINTNGSHGLVSGNRVTLRSPSGSVVGNYIVDSESDVDTFTAIGDNTDPTAMSGGHVFKHGLSSNKGVSDRTGENLQARGVTIFDGEILTLTESSGITASTTSFSVSGAQGGVIERFPLGTYIQVDEEIMRVSSNSLSGVPADKITVIRGVLATKATTHVVNSQIKRIKVPAIEFRRPSILRASSHTFEYLGYGPGNYSTALPQVQDRTLTEREEFLSQSQERSNGLVVYTGMNNKGDFFIGNQKKSSATGEEINFDIPVSTVTGEDPARLSAVFDEVIIKERLVVEGGKSNQVLSQFDGPVTFNEKTKFDSNVKISSEVGSASTTSGALVVTGGIGVGGTITASDATIGNVTIDGSTKTISTLSGNLKLTTLEGSRVAIQTNTKITGITTIIGDTKITGDTTITGVTTITGNTDIVGNLDLTGSASTQGRISANYLDVPNISPVGSIMIWPGATNTWPTTNWRQCNGATLSKTTYPELFAVIEYTYGGSGDDFKLPNLKGKFVTGVGSDDWNNTLNTTGGRADAILPQHHHDIDDPGHQHDFNAAKVDQSVTESGNGDDEAQNKNMKTDLEETGITVDNVDDGETNAVVVNNQATINVANLPPYTALYYIIRIQ